MKKLLLIIVLLCTIAISSIAQSFTLTHALGIGKLPKNATFNMSGSVWVLDYHNGTSLTYTVISGNKYTPLCDIKTIDGNGDKCTICITKDGENAIIQFKYSGFPAIQFKGYYNK